MGSRTAATFFINDSGLGSSCKSVCARVFVCVRALVRVLALAAVAGMPTTWRETAIHSSKYTCARPIASAVVHTYRSCSDGSPESTSTFVPYVKFSHSEPAGVSSTRKYDISIVYADVGMWIDLDTCGWIRAYIRVPESLLPSKPASLPSITTRTHTTHTHTHTHTPARACAHIPTLTLAPTYHSHAWRLHSTHGHTRTHSHTHMCAVPEKSTGSGGTTSLRSCGGRYT
jgi:hypothetical protein